MLKFEVGKTYYARSFCDYDCIWSYEATKRTDKTVTLKGNCGNNPTCRIRVRDGIETVKPRGSYSMAPILSADKSKRPE